eukprot:723856-Rhodomonas_salina.1
MNREHWFTEKARSGRVKQRRYMRDPTILWYSRLNCLSTLCGGGQSALERCVLASIGVDTGVAPVIPNRS